MPTDKDVVQTASDAAEGVIFSNYKQSNVTDVDVSVTFDDGILDIDVYLNAPDSAGAADPEQVTEDAALAAQAAVDELFTNE